MRGRTPTKAERELWGALACRIGCIACHLDGQPNFHVSIHHTDGRTKPDAHKKVLPLCAAHHQHDDTDPAGRIGVHPYKARFEAKYGTQAELIELCMSMLDEVTA